MGQRRKAGEGTLPRWDATRGLWWSQITVNGVNHKSYGKTEAGCYRNQETWKREALAGVRAGASTEKLSDYIDWWMANGTGHLSDSTIRTYRNQLRAATRAMGQVRLRDLTPEMLTEFYVSERTVKSPYTVANTADTLRKALADAVRFKRLAVNPAQDALRPRRDQPEMRCLTESELGDFLFAGRSEWLYPAFVVLVGTGMREGELFGLEWKHVDFEAGVIAIEQQCRQFKVGDTSWHLAPPKTKESRRRLRFNARVADALHAQEEWVLWQTKRWGAWQGKYDFAFRGQRTRSGNPLFRTTLDKAVKRVAERAGVETFRVHDLRHTYATLALQNGAKLLDVSKRLGHKDVAFTLRKYGHVTETMETETAAIMDDVLRDAIGEDE